MAGVTAILQVNLKKGKCVKKLHSLVTFNKRKGKSPITFLDLGQIVFVTLKNLWYSYTRNSQFQTELGTQFFANVFKRALTTFTTFRPLP